MTDTLTSVDPVTAHIVEYASGNETVLPKAEVRGEGTVVYRCAACSEPAARPVFTNAQGQVFDILPADLTPDIRAYHPEHVGDRNGR